MSSESNDAPSSSKPPQQVPQFLYIQSPSGGAVKVRCVNTAVSSQAASPKISSTLVNSAGNVIVPPVVARKLIRPQLNFGAKQPQIIIQTSLPRNQSVSSPGVTPVSTKPTVTYISNIAQSQTSVSKSSEPSQVVLNPAQLVSSSSQKKLILTPVSVMPQRSSASTNVTTGHSQSMLVPVSLSSRAQPSSSKSGIINLKISNGQIQRSDYQTVKVCETKRVVAASNQPSSVKSNIATIANLPLQQVVVAAGSTQSSSVTLQAVKNDNDKTSHEPAISRVVAKPGNRMKPASLLSLQSAIMKHLPAQSAIANQVFAVKSVQSKNVTKTRTQGSNNPNIASGSEVTALQSNTVNSSDTEMQQTFNRPVFTVHQEGDKRLVTVQTVGKQVLCLQSVGQKLTPVSRRIVTLQPMKGKKITLQAIPTEQKRATASNNVSLNAIARNDQSSVSSNEPVLENENRFARQDTAAEMNYNIPADSSFVTHDATAEMNYNIPADSSFVTHDATAEMNYIPADSSFVTHDAAAEMNDNIPADSSFARHDATAEMNYNVPTDSFARHDAAVEMNDDIPADGSSTGRMFTDDSQTSEMSVDSGATEQMSQRTTDSQMSFESTVTDEISLHRTANNLMSLDAESSNNNMFIHTTANDLMSVDTKSSNKMSVDETASDLMSIDKIASDLMSLDTESSKKMPVDIDKTASDLMSVDTGSSNKMSVNIAASDLMSIDKIASDLMSLDTESSNKISVDKTASDLISVDTGSSNKMSLNIAASDLISIDKIASDLMSVDTESSKEIPVDIDKAASDLMSVDTGSSNKMSVNIAASDLMSIDEIASDLMSVDTESSKEIPVDIDKAASDLMSVDTGSSNKTSVNITASDLMSMEKAASDLMSVNTNSSNKMDKTASDFMAVDTGTSSDRICVDGSSLVRNNKLKAITSSIATTNNIIADNVTINEVPENFGVGNAMDLGSTEGSNALSHQPASVEEKIMIQLVVDSKGLRFEPVTGNKRISLENLGSLKSLSLCMKNGKLSVPDSAVINSAEGASDVPSMKLTSSDKILVLKQGDSILKSDCTSEQRTGRNIAIDAKTETNDNALCALSNSSDCEVTKTSDNKLVGEVKIPSSEVVSNSEFPNNEVKPEAVKPQQPSERTRRRKMSHSSKKKPFMFNADDFDPMKVLDWKDGIGELPGSKLKFRVNEFGLMEMVEDDCEQAPLKRVDSRRKRKANDTDPSTSGSSKGGVMMKRRKDPDELYCCETCGCYGLSSEFYAWNFCSVACSSSSPVKKVTENKKEKEEDVLNLRRRRKRLMLLLQQQSEQNTTLLSAVREACKMIEAEFVDRAPARKSLTSARRSPGASEDDNTTDEKEQAAVLKKPWQTGKSGFSWTRYLEHCKAVRAPQKLFQDPFPYCRNAFKAGMKLEGIDPKHQAYVCVLTVKEIRGYRMRLHFDGYSDSHDFWVNADSMDIFPAGWCEKNNLQFLPPKGFKAETFNWGSYLKESKAQAAQRSLFVNKTRSAVCPSGFRMGMKLEAVNKRNHAMVCVATVRNMLGSRILVQLDGYGDTHAYWAEVSSPYLHPVGWCEEHGKRLHPPKDYEDPESFSWEKYLQETKSVAAPPRAFKLRPASGFRCGMKLECVDKRVPALIRVATVQDVKEHRLKISFDGWPSEYNIWMDDDSLDIHPPGWCHKTGHPLESPLILEEMEKSDCPVLVCSGVGHIKGHKFSTHSRAEDCPYATENLKKRAIVDRLASNRHAADVSRKRKSSDVVSNREGRPPKWHRVDDKAKVKLENVKTENMDDDKSKVKMENVKTENMDDEPEHAAQNNQNRKRKVRDVVKSSREKRQGMTQEDIYNEIKESIFNPGYNPATPNRSRCMWSKQTLYLKAHLRQPTLPDSLKDWGPDEVSRYVACIPGLQETAEKFKSLEIEGDSFVMLTQKDLINVIGCKLGPAIKIYNSIRLLRSKYNLK